MLKKMSFSLLAVSCLFGSGDIELNINNDTVEFNGDINLNDRYILNENSNYYLNVRYLYMDEKNGFVNNKKLVSGGFKVVSPYYSDSGVKFGIGADFIAVDNSDKTFTGMPISIFANMALIDRVSIGVNVKYSPSVLTFGDGENYKEFNSRVNYNIIDNVDIFVGYRNIKTKYTAKSGLGELEFDSSAYFGAKISF